MSELLGVVVGGALAFGGAFFQQWWANRAIRNEHAHYLAVRLICALDGYIDGCASVAIDDGIRPGLGEPDELKVQAELPKLNLPEDVDWKSVSYKLTYNVLTLPSHIKAANELIGVEAEHGDQFQYFEERRRRHMELGLRISELAHTVRSEFALPRRESIGWDPHQLLLKVRDEFAELDRKRSTNTGESTS